jgi:hypothetical protein
MQTLAANVNNNIPGVAPNDLYLDGDGNIAMSFGIEAVLEACAEAARTLLGEMLYNADQGIPYQQLVWVGVPNIAQFTAALQSAFLAVPNVLQVVSLTTSQGPSPAGAPGEPNQLNYSAVIQTAFGTGVVNG